MFSPKTKYLVKQDNIRLKRFADYPDLYVARPPYQRKSVWSTKKQRALLDSLFRRYYVPRLVIREIDLGSDIVKREIVDGQQRITTVQRFFADQLRLPSTLKNLHHALPGKLYSELPPNIRMFADEDLKFEADVVHGIDDPYNPDHQQVATEIFWRLQQGESLNYMEEAHARLSSLTRNFVVKYADDITFDFAEYAPVDENPNKHLFFSLIKRGNNRMQHLALLVRFLLLEEGNGRADLQNTNVQTYIDDHRQKDGIDNESFEKTAPAKAVLRTMNELYATFKDDPAHSDGSPIPELAREYIIISLFLLVRHLVRHYAFHDAERDLVRRFFHDFAERHSKVRQAGGDPDLLMFSDHRQHSARDVEIRDQIMRQHLFQYAAAQGVELRVKDEQRTFNEAERIAIYRKGRGLCKACLDAGLSEKEAQVAWANYEADHVLPHAHGGSTIVENGQVLCMKHNKAKGASIPASLAQ